MNWFGEKVKTIKLTTTLKITLQYTIKTREVIIWQHQQPKVHKRYMFLKGCARLLV